MLAQFTQSKGRRKDKDSWTYSPHFIVFYKQKMPPERTRALVSLGKLQDVFVIYDIVFRYVESPFDKRKGIKSEMLTSIVFPPELAHGYTLRHEFDELP